MKSEIKIPTMNELVAETDESFKENALMVILNQPPPKEWMKEHPMAKTKNAQGQTVPASYMPIERVEYLLNRIYGKWRVEIRDSKLVANSVQVTVRVHVLNPITKEWDWNDGIGASPIQTDSGAAATDWSKVKSAGVQMAAPSAETYAIKDAAEKFGKIFGKDANRQVQIDYNSLLKVNNVTPVEDLQFLLDAKREVLSKEEIDNAERIINNNEVKQFNNLRKTLSEK